MPAHHKTRQEATAAATTQQLAVPNNNFREHQDIIELKRDYLYVKNGRTQKELPSRHRSKHGGWFLTLDKKAAMGYASVSVPLYMCASALI